VRLPMAMCFVKMALQMAFRLVVVVVVLTLVAVQ
jgi:hypothetical protein